MKTSIKILVPLIFILALLLAACTSAPIVTNPELTPTLPPVQDLFTPEAKKDLPAQPTGATSEQIPETGNLTREDSQGNVTVMITPLNLDQPAETLDFEVALETHSVDLSMDLAQLATLTTDTGKSIQPVKWDAPMGGHHVSGTLIFPANQDGASFLDRATILTLTLRNVDAPERVFTWNLPPA